MKKWLVVLLLGCAIGMGCQKNVVKAPLPVAAVNQFDADTYRGLVDAQAAINSLKADIDLKKLAPSPALKTALNQAITDYNVADALWQSYHASAAGTLAQAPVQNAVTKLNSDVSALGGVR